MAVDRPIAGAPDPSAFLAGYFDAIGMGQQTGTRTVRQYSGGVSLKDELKGLPKSVLAELKRQGVNLNANYGQSSEDIRTLRNRITYLKRYAGAKDEFGRGMSEKLSRSISNLATDALATGESQYELSTERLKGLEGVGTLSRFRAARQLQQKGIDLATADAGQIAKALGIDRKDIGKEGLAELREQFAGEDFQTFNLIEDTARQSLQTQQEQLKNFQAAQKRVNAPGYAEQAANAAFAPQETELNQFYRPQGGASISEAGAMRGEQEAALGRTGYDRVAAEGQRQEGLARERLGSQKSAARQQIQQYIDTQNPLAALQAGQQVGQLGMGNLDYQRQQLLAPYAAVFPMMGQAYQQSLLPFQMQQQVQSGPEWYDYALSGVGALGSLAGGIGSAAYGFRR